MPVTVNGTRANQSNYMLDGGNNIDEYTNVNAPFPMPDSLQEFSVQTSNYSAEYGQNAGGVVNIVTLGGGNSSMVTPLNMCATESSTPPITLPTWGR